MENEFETWKAQGREEKRVPGPKTIGTSMANQKQIEKMANTSREKKCEVKAQITGSEGNGKNMGNKLGQTRKYMGDK